MNEYSFQTTMPFKWRHQRMKSSKTQEPVDVSHTSTGPQQLSIFIGNESEEPSL